MRAKISDKASSEPPPRSRVIYQEALRPPIAPIAQAGITAEHNAPDFDIRPFLRGHVQIAKSLIYKMNHL